MANKLKNMRLTSVDLVRNGANQEADICLFKSADPDDAAQAPTTEEKNIFKRFINWLRENPTEAGGEPADPETVEKDYTTFDSLNTSRENNEKLWQYTNALCESIRSIQMDHDLDKNQKHQLMAQSLEQFDAAMDDLIGALCKAAPSRTESVMAKSDPDDDDDWYDDDDWEEDGDDDDVQKFNPNHDAKGRFTSGGGGGGGGNAAAKYYERLNRVHTSDNMEEVLSDVLKDKTLSNEEKEKFIFYAFALEDSWYGARKSAATAEIEEV